MDAQEAKRLVLEKYPKAYSDLSTIGGGVYITVPQNGHIAGGRLSGYFPNANEAWIDAATRFSPQPETAQGDRCALCGADKDDHYDDVQCPVGPDTWSSVYSFTPRKPEPSQQENAPQHSYTPEEAIRIVLEAFENSEADGYRSRDRQFAIDIFRHTAPSQPQPAESDGFEEKEILLPELPGKERFMLWIEYWRDVALPCRDAQLRTALVRAKAAEAKLESLLAQKPEAMVSDVDIAFITAVCDGGRVDKAINELLAYRQIFKDAEKGQGK